MTHSLSVPVVKIPRRSIPCLGRGYTAIGQLVKKASKGVHVTSGWRNAVMAGVFPGPHMALPICKAGQMFN